MMGNPFMVCLARQVRRHFWQEYPEQFYPHMRAFLDLPSDVCTYDRMK